MNALLSRVIPQPSLENNLQCQLCLRPFAPDSDARAAWRRDPLQALPMSCPHCRATNIYRFDNLIMEPRPVLSRNPARLGESLPRVRFVSESEDVGRPSRRR
jgi:hypothetical protein